MLQYIAKTYYNRLEKKGTNLITTKQYADAINAYEKSEQNGELFEKIILYILQIVINVTLRASGLIDIPEFIRYVLAALNILCVYYIYENTRLLYTRFPSPIQREYELYDSYPIEYDDPL